MKKEFKVVFGMGMSLIIIGLLGLFIREILPEISIIYGVFILLLGLLMKYKKKMKGGSKNEHKIVDTGKNRKRLR